MYRKSRLDDILDIMRKNGYVTVRLLTERLHYSTATINRDLNLLEKQKLITRSYGGAELAKPVTVPLAMRYHKAHAAKNRVAAKAAELVADGDTVFIDGTSTTQYLGQYLTERKNLTVITNNLALATFLSEHGIRVTVLGGNIAEAPSIVGGAAAAESTAQYHADKVFFSVGAVAPDGTLLGGPTHTAMLRTMLRNSDRQYLLTDRTKLGYFCCHEIVAHADALTGVVSDGVFDEEYISAHPDVQFYNV